MATKGPCYRGFFERNAGKLLIWAFAGPIPLRILGMATGTTPWVADILFAVLIVSAICGYIARWRRSRRNNTDTDTATSTKANTILKGFGWGVLGLFVFVTAVLVVTIVVLGDSPEDERDSGLPKATAPKSFAPTAASLPSTPTPLPADFWMQMEEIQDRLAEVYAHYDAMVIRFDECALPDSVLDQAESDSEVLSKLELQTEAQQAIAKAQLPLKDVDLDKPGKEGYALLFELQLAWNAYFRATRELLKVESAIFEANGCAMPPLPNWLTDL